MRKLWGGGPGHLVACVANGVGERRPPPTVLANKRLQGGVSARKAAEADIFDGRALLRNRGPENEHGSSSEDGNHDGTRYDHLYLRLQIGTNGQRRRR